MKPIHMMGMICMSVLVGTAALAQGNPGAGPGAGPGPAASAPATTWPGQGRDRAMRRGAVYTPGWSMMTRAERNAHQERLRAMQSYEECKTYMTQHHEQMMARAKERGRPALGQPRRDVCAGLKP